jgi:chaperone modulatory protein CbpM
VTPEDVSRLVAGVEPAQLQIWIDRAWLRPQRDGETWIFAEIDVARVRLIITLERELEIDAEAVPVVLSLLDQLHDARRELHTLHVAIQEALPAPQHRLLAETVQRHVEAWLAPRQTKP